MIFKISIKLLWAGEMDQWLRALTDLLEDMGSILSTHTMAHNGLQLQLQGFSGLHGYQAYSWHKDIYEYKTPMYINKNFKQLK